LARVPLPEGAFYDDLCFHAQQAAEKAHRTGLAMREALERLRKLESGGVEGVGAGAGPERPLRRPRWFERYRWFISSDGHLVLAGRDAASNERLVKRHMREGDVYAHADLHGAPSVVVKAREGWGLRGAGSGGDVRAGVGTDGDGATGGGGKAVDAGGAGEIPERTLREACTFALACSRAWAAGLASGSAYWVRPEQVSQTPESGEYLPRGAFVVRGRRNYYHNLELRLAMGWVELGGERLLMCGPESALRARAKKVLGVQPGQDESLAVARRAAAELGCSPDEILRLLPPGRSQLIESS